MLFMFYSKKKSYTLHKFKVPPQHYAPEKDVLRPQHLEVV